MAILNITASLSSQPSRVIRVPEDHPTIQSAVDATSSGDTVLIDHGRYMENVRIAKNIVLASRFILDRDTSHVSRTIIDGGRPKDRRKGSAVTITGGTDTTCLLLGFTIRNGSGSEVYVKGDPGEEYWIEGGGVLIKDAGARIAFNTIVQNLLMASDTGRYTAAYGAGIATTTTNFGTSLPFVIIESNTVIGNTVTGKITEGAGIGIGQPGVVRHNVVTGNRIVSRRRALGGGIELLFDGNYDITVDGNYISRNSAGIGAGLLISSIFVRRGRAIITNNVFTENVATEVGGAVNVAEEAYAIFVNNTIVRNKALSTGGGINATYGSHTVLVNNILWGNESDQISMWGEVQATNNLVGGGLPGRHNIDADPGFLPDDSLFRLSPGSPCIGIGTKTLQLVGNALPIPDHDLKASLRPAPTQSAPDLGAIESPWSESRASRVILRDRAASADAFAKLAVIIRQVSPTERDSATQQIVRAGRTTSTVLLNDSLITVLDGAQPDPFLELPPGENLLEIEASGRGLDSTKAIGAFFWLEGFDPHVYLLNQRRGSFYRYYSNLGPGTYRLVIQPQDEMGYIGNTNRVSLSIVVLPHWYQQWWAYLLYALTVLSMAFVVFRVRVNRLRLQFETSRLTELDKMKSRFFANLSHEFRTPLSLILGPVDQLEASEPEAGRKEQLGLIRRNAERLLRMVNLLLQFARIESRTLKLHVSLQPIPQLLRRIVSSFSTAAVKKGIGLHVEIDPPDFEGYLDSEKIEHVLENLLSNAVKYSHAGGRVDVRARRVNTELVVEVADTGHGIAPEHVLHVFERFYRVDSSHQYEGTGIGLSLSKELVETHHGSIGLKSTLGMGTVVTFRLPLSGYQEHQIVKWAVPPQDGRAAEVDQIHIRQEIPDRENGEKMVVLIAEDNAEAREYLRSRLAPDFDVIEAADGADAWKSACERIPDVVVSDVMMPKMSGYELCGKLKQDERTSHIPVILLTALADRTEKIEGLRIGADDYLAKPFDAQELLVRVQNLVKGRRSLQERFRASVPLKPGEVAVKSLDDRFLSKARAVVENHIADEEFSIEQFATKVFLSRAQLHRKIKALTGLNATDFVRYLRLHRAKSLLEKNAGSVADVAYQTGFTDPNYFARAFKQQFGTPPSEVKNPS